MRILSVVGTRPQLIKAAALTPVLRARHHEILVDTGQHYDEAMAGVFFAELGLPRPDHSLGVGGGSHAEQTAAMLVALEPIVAEVRPDAVLVYGDTNSTLAGALVAAKLTVPVAHVEAGLRSFDRRMPEEVNRIVADHLSRWLFAPTPAAVDNLAAEGVTDGVELVGDLMQDLAARMAPEIRDPAVLRAVPLDDVGLTSGGYLLATIHRAENRVPAAIRSWAAMLRAVARRDRPVILMLHPGTRAALAASGEDLGPDVRLSEPLGYRSSLTLQLHAQPCSPTRAGSSGNPVGSGSRASSCGRRPNGWNSWLPRADGWPLWASTRTEPCGSWSGGRRSDPGRTLLRRGRAMLRSPPPVPPTRSAAASPPTIARDKVPPVLQYGLHQYGWRGLGGPPGWDDAKA